MKKQLCRNCGHEVESLYCSNCGQNNNVARLNWGTLADNFLSTFVGDGTIGDKRRNIRYGFLLTIWSVVTRPGETVAEFLEGRRRKYFNPVTILLMLSGFYALVSVFSGVVEDTVKQSDTVIGQYLNLFWSYCQSHPAMMSLLLLPFTALAYKWIFRKCSDLLYIEYAYVGIFAAIFSVVILIVRLPFDAFQVFSPFSSYITAASIAAECWFAMTVFRALFKVSWRRALWSWIKAMILSYTFIILVSAVLLIAAMYIYYLISPEEFTQTFQFLIKTPDENVQEAAKRATEVLNQAADSLRTK